MLFALAVPAEPLPRPAGLEPDIGFWRATFAEISSEQAFIHDNRYLAVVYETVEIPVGASSKKMRQVSKNARKKYQKILNKLADGKRKGLTTNERRVLSLWPEDISNDELRKAARRVRFQQGLSDRFRDGLIRSGQWQEYIRTSLREAGVPESLASLPHVESSYNPEARSHVGAAGLWQFTRSTGRRFMQIDHVVDERRDPYRSSDSAARLLQYNYSILKSWPLAITAYNHGVAGMRRAVKRTGTDDIEVILRKYDGRSFGFASRNFYVAFLAAHEVEQNAEKYFGILEKSQPRRDIVGPVPDYMAVDTLASAFDVSHDTLKQYNPALLPAVWSGTKYVPRGFTLRLPDRSSDRSPTQIMATIAGDQRFDAQTPDLKHKVERGDSLSGIAARYGTSVSELVAINNLRSRHRIRVGQTLNLPYRGRASMATIPEGVDIYVVQTGDTVGTIAKRAGVDQRQLLALNSLSNKNRIYPGQDLVLRVAEEPPPAVSVSTAKPASSESEPRPASRDRAAIEVAIVDDKRAEEVAEIIGDPVQQATELVLLADPSDYLVAADDTIEVQAAETLGHYADWLNIPTQILRDLNGYSFRRPLVIGHRLRLDFSNVDKGQFTAFRIAYHRELQEEFFARYHIVDTTVHNLRRGESLFVLSLRRYKVPVWLLRQYNPDLNLDRVQPGTEIVFPKIALAEAAGESDPAVTSSS